MFKGYFPEGMIGTERLVKLLLGSTLSFIQWDIFSLIKISVGLQNLNPTVSVGCHSPVCSLLFSLLLMFPSVGISSKYGTPW